MNEILKGLLNRLDKAKADLEKLDTLIEVAQEAGEDVSELIVKRDSLKERIEAWERAIKSRLG